MAKPKRKAQARLKARQAFYDAMVSRDKAGGKSYTRPGSLNRHKRSS